MKIITLASAKGGAGKSTAAMAIASGLVALAHKVAIIDSDINRPLPGWEQDGRAKGNWDDNCRVFWGSGMEEIDALFGEIETAGDFDFVLIDTEGGMSEVNNATIVSADLVLIPVSLTHLDLRATMEAFALIAEELISNECKMSARLLIQKFPAPSRMTRHKSDLLELLWEIPRLDTPIMERNSYSLLAGSGMPHIMLQNMLENRTNPLARKVMRETAIECGHLATEVINILGES